MDDLALCLELTLDPPPELDQPRQLSRLHPLGARGIEGTPERDVDITVADAHRRRPDVRRHVAEAHRTHLAALDAGPRLEPTRWHVDDDAPFAVPGWDDPLVECPGDERDRAVTACRRVA